MTDDRSFPTNTSEFVAMINNRVFPSSPEFRMRLRSSLVHSFIGKIDSKIRGVQVKYEDVNSTKINCYIEGEFTEEEREEISEVETEIICDFCTPYNEINIWIEIIRIDSPNPLPQDYSAPEEWFYRKKASRRCD
jgi:hypothetical protein